MRQRGKAIVELILFWCARFVLWRFDPAVIGIAGSTNKTTVKNAVRSLFSNTETVRCNPKSYNTEIGLPLAVLGIDGGKDRAFMWVVVAIRALLVAVFSVQFPALLILELGVDRTGDMEKLLKIVKLRALIVTGVETVSSLSTDGEARTMLSELMAAVEQLPTRGVLVLNADDPVVRTLISVARCPVITYGKRSDAMIVIGDVHTSHEGIRAQLTDSLSAKTRGISIQKFGLHHIRAAAAASAVRTILSSWNVAPLSV